MSLRAHIFLTIAGLVTAAHAQILHVGDPAPELRISDVVKGEPVARLNRGEVYVVDFWSTWCAPCRKGMPHLSDLQCEYAPQGVKVIGVAVMDEATNVGAFMSGEGDYPAGDWMMQYTVAIEAPIEAKDSRRGGQMTEQWLRASGRSEIPTAFIVDRNGDIAWIGHPSWPTGELEDYLDHVVNGTLTEQRRGVLEEHWSYVGELSKRVGALAKAGDFEGALEAMDELESLNPRSRRDLARARFEILLMGMDEPQRAYEFIRQATATSLRDFAWELNYIAWMIVDNPRVEHRDYDVAIEMADRACELTGWKDPAVLDTLAKAYYDSGSRERGLELQRAAVKYAKGTRWQEELETRLARYEREMGID